MLVQILLDERNRNQFELAAGNCVWYRWHKDNNPKLLLSPKQEDSLHSLKDYALVTNSASNLSTALKTRAPSLTEDNIASFDFFGQIAECGFLWLLNQYSVFPSTQGFASY